MKTNRSIVIAGASGFLGGILSRYFSNQGWKVTALVRFSGTRVEGAQTVVWNGRSLGSWVEQLEGADVLINMCGKSVDCRYTKKNKALIYSSRLESTRALGLAMLKANNPPKIWLNAASATIYRHAEDRPMTEADGEIGDGFSVDVCQQWERLFFSFDLPTVRKVALRTSFVLGQTGEALQVLARLARLGLGGAQGNGRQILPWIHEEDFCRALDFIIQHPEMEGAINVTGPQPVSNGEFMHRLRKACRVRLGLPTPGWLLHIGAWIMRTEPELVLKSRWVLPERLSQAGFEWKYPGAQQALDHLLAAE